MLQTNGGMHITRETEIYNVLLNKELTIINVTFQKYNAMNSQQVVSETFGR